MPVTLFDNYGKHPNVKVLQFGEGDIMFSRGVDVHNNESHESLIIFSVTEPRKIGEETHAFAGKPSDELPNIEVIFKFTKPESIAVLIHTLVEIQQQLF